MCQAAIVLHQILTPGDTPDDGAGSRFRVPSPADGLALVPGFTELSEGFFFFKIDVTAKQQQIPAQQMDSQSELAGLSVLG